MTEKELEKLFKSKLDNREFAFNPENWQKMEAILDESAVAKGGYFWRSSAAIVLFGAIVASLIYFNPGTKGSSIASDQVLTPQDQNTKEIYQRPLEQKTSSDQQNISSGDQKIVTNSPSTLPESQVNVNSDAERITSVADQPASTASSSPTEIQPIAASAEEGSIQENQYNDVLANSSQDQDVVEDNITVAAIQPAIAPENLAKVDAQDLVMLSLKKYDGLDIDLANLEYMNPGLAALTSNSQVLDKSGKPLGIFVNGGLLFTGSNTNNTLGTGYHAGVGYRKGLNHGFMLETGISYVVLNDINIQDNSDSVFFGFGMERIETEEINRRLDYIEVPLNLSYRLTPKHALGLGAYASVLVNVSRDVETTRHSPKGGVSVSNSQSSGYLEEFDRFDLGFNAFYRYKVSSRFNVGLHFKTGLRDITKDVSVDYAEDHTNFNTRIVLEYSLF